MIIMLSHGFLSADEMQDSGLERRDKAISLFKEIEAIKLKATTPQQAQRIAKLHKKLRENCNKWGDDEKSIHAEKRVRQEITNRIYELKFKGDILSIDLYEGSRAIVIIRTDINVPNSVMVCYLIKFDSVWNRVHVKGSMW